MTVIIEYKLHDDQGKPVALTAEDVCLMLLGGLKVGRGIQGLINEEFHEDTYTDIPGYAGCAEKIAEERAAVVEPF